MLLIECNTLVKILIKRDEYLLLHKTKCLALACEI